MPQLPQPTIPQLPLPTNILPQLPFGGGEGQEEQQPEEHQPQQHQPQQQQSEEQQQPESYTESPIRQGFQEYRNNQLDIIQSQLDAIQNQVAGQGVAPDNQWSFNGADGTGGSPYSFQFAQPQGEDYVNPYAEGDASQPGCDAQPISENEGWSGSDGPADGAGSQGQTNGENSTETPSEAESLFESALLKFQQGDLDGAIKSTEKARKLVPNNADLHQFRSLILFANGEYRRSAAAAHKALTGAPGWNWKTLRSLYASKEQYTKHLRALEIFTDKNLKSAEGRFLLGYHYLMLGHLEAGKKQLRKSVELEPKDGLSSMLLAAIESSQKAAK